jgi:putative two-component system response regulator
MIQFDKKKILIVDDSQFHLEAAGRILQKEYTITGVRSGKEALACIIKGLNPDLILVDIALPSMDGWEIYNRLRAISYLTEVPIAFLSSENAEKDKNRAIEIGAAEYFIKPFNEEDLQLRIAKIFEKKDSETHNGITIA